MRILYGSPYGPFKCWLGEEGGSDRIIFLSRNPYPWLTIGRA